MMDEVMVKTTGKRGVCPICHTDVAEVGPTSHPVIAVHYRNGRRCGGSSASSEGLRGVYVVEVRRSQP